MNRQTPMRRTLCMLVLPAMVAGVLYSCATTERTVQVPALKNAVVTVRYVRVLVGSSTRTEPLIVSTGQPARIWAGDGRTLLDTKQLAAVKVASYKGAVALGDVTWNLAAMTIEPAEGDHVSVGAKTYPGLIVLVSRGESVMAINYVQMEDYVAGVVSCEMPITFANPACETQAVAARTYALWNMGQSRLMPYDLKDSQASQVYEGLTKTTIVGTRAARRTAGVIMVYGSDWEFLPAFYASTCGGYTAPPREMSGAPDIGPLQGVPCGYCTASSRYKWTVTVPASEMESLLITAGYVTGRLTDIRVVAAAPGGWVDAVDIASTGGVKRLTGAAFRQVVGTSKLLSSNFVVSAKDDVFVIDGKGWGHGVGMCQWGADGMAREGFDYAQILTHYYPGIRLIKIY